MGRLKLEGLEESYRPLGANLYVIRKHAVQPVGNTTKSGAV